MMKRISHQFKLIMQPYYRSGKITKDEYKDIMRKAVPAVRYFSMVYTIVSFMYVQYGCVSHNMFLLTLSLVESNLLQ